MRRPLSATSGPSAVATASITRSGSRPWGPPIPISMSRWSRSPPISSPHWASPPRRSGSTRWATTPVDLPTSTSCARTSRSGATCSARSTAIAANANPLRVLDCKRKECLEATVGAPALADHLCDACREHFDRVREGLEALGIAYELDHRLVRGFDYYTRTTFEFASRALESAQNGIGGGGRYDRLVEMLGGPPTPGIGFGIGIERVLLACDAEGVFATDPASPDAFVVDVVGGSTARDLTARLRRAGLHADRAFEGRTMKAQLRAADHSGARVALIVGPDEVAEGTVSLKPLRGDGEQRIVQVADVVEAVRTVTDAGEASELSGAGSRREKDRR